MEKESILSTNESSELNKEKVQEEFVKLLKKMDSDETLKNSSYFEYQKPSTVVDYYINNYNGTEIVNLRILESEIDLTNIEQDSTKQQYTGKNKEASEFLKKWIEKELINFPFNARVI